MSQQKRLFSTPPKQRKPHQKRMAIIALPTKYIPPNTPKTTAMAMIGNCWDIAVIKYILTKTLPL